MSNQEMLDYLESQLTSAMYKVTELEQEIVRLRELMKRDAEEKSNEPKVCHVCHGEGVVTENGRLRTCVFC